MSHTRVLAIRVLAIISGFVVGGFLFFQYSRLLTTNMWGLGWYEGALFLAGLGLAGSFRGAFLSVALSTAGAGFLYASIQTYGEISSNPYCCNLWPIALMVWLFVGFPAPLIGGAIGYGLSCTRAPRLLFLLPVAAALGIGACLPLIRQADYRRLEIEEISTMLKRMSAAEISFSAGRADRAFTCDGGQLQDLWQPRTVRILRWNPDTFTNSSNSSVAYFTFVEPYTVRLECPNEASPHHFRIMAFSRRLKQPGPTFSIDETGKLVISNGPAGQPR